MINKNDRFSMHLDFGCSEDRQDHAKRRPMPMRSLPYQAPVLHSNLQSVHSSRLFQTVSDMPEEVE